MTPSTTTAMLASTTTATTTTVEMADEYDYGDYDYVEMTLPVQTSTGIGLAFLIVVGISGNAMTIAAYATDKTRKTAYDFVIFQLAVTDLLISCISMPFYAVYTLMGFTWPFGYAFCKIWLTADFTFCLESIFLMLLLSLDRLLMLIYGSHYSVRMTLTIARIQVLATWIVSFLVYGPAILGWNHWVGYSTVEKDDCDVEFAYDFSFTAGTSIVEFVLPFICLSGMNAVIYLKIRSRHRTVWSTAQTGASTSIRSVGNVSSQVPLTKSQQPSVVSVASTVLPCSSVTTPNSANGEVATLDKAQTKCGSKDQGNNLNGSGHSQGEAKAESNQEQIQAEYGTNDQECKLNGSGNWQAAKVESNQEQNQAKCWSKDQWHNLKESGNSQGGANTESNQAQIQAKYGSKDQESNMNGPGSSQGEAKAESNQVQIQAKCWSKDQRHNLKESGNSQGGSKAESNQSQIQIKREVKAARFLAILVVVFLLLWAPYTVTTMVIAFCGDKCLNVSLYEFFNWVLWIKSAVNPLLYALNSSFYRRHFVRFLRLNGRLQSLRTGRVGPA